MCIFRTYLLSLALFSIQVPRRYLIFTDSNAHLLSLVLPSKFHLTSFPDSFSCTADFNIVSPPDSPVLLYQSQTIQIFLARSLTNENFPRLCSQDPLLPYVFPRKFPSDSACHDISHLKSSHKFFFRRLRTSTIHVNFLVTFIV